MLPDRKALREVLIHRPLTREEAELLHDELKTTPNILGYSVEELVRFPEVFIAESNGAFAGACVSKDLRFGWTDIALLYTLPAFRGRGIGKALYAAAWQRAWERGRHVFTLSRSPEVIRMMERFEMELSRAMWQAPLAVHLHMNRHMMSSYRIREALRKSREMGSQPPFVFGTKRNRSAGVAAGP